jgi:hypothetical protein
MGFLGRCVTFLSDDAHADCSTDLAARVGFLWATPIGALTIRRRRHHSFLMRAIATMTTTALILAGCELANSQMVTPPTLASNGSQVETIQRRSLACLERATLDRQLSQKQEGLLKKELVNKIKSGRCRYLPVGSQVEVVDGALYTREVTVAGLENHWWIYFTDTMTQEEIEDPANLARLDDDLEKSKLQRLLRQNGF